MPNGMPSIYSLALAIIWTLSVTSSCQTSAGEADTATSSSANAPASQEPTKDLGQAGVQDKDSDPNILDIAISSEPHSTLVAAVQAAQIEHVLVNAGPLTVFAPVNEAFEKLPEGMVEKLMKPESQSELATILTRHAAPGKFDLEGLRKEARKGRKLYMATSDYFEVTTDGDQVLVNGVPVLQSIPASNGVIHVVDQILLP